MKELSFEEFQDRLMAVQRAEAIFSNLTDKNITLAFRAYQAVCSDRNRQLVMWGSDQKTIMDNYERPKCPTCGEDMKFRPVQNENPEGIKMQLRCPTPTCPDLNSEHDIQWWMQNLKKKK